jgi:hypothetical protein
MTVPYFTTIIIKKIPILKISVLGFFYFKKENDLFQSS